MKLIKKLIEDAAVAAVGATDVASAATPLFAGLSKRNLPIKIKITKPKKKEKETFEGKTIGLSHAFHSINEGDDALKRGQATFDTSGVISKLKSIEAKNAGDMKDVQAFVLEDDDGRAVKVWVRGDQAASFESALNAFLSDRDESEKQSVPEIAEMIFKLKDHFDIVDIVWPDVTEDEEEDQTVAAQPGEEGLGGDDLGGDDLGDVPGEEGLGGDDLGGLPADGGEESVKSLLNQVIDMMKADAEARKADARAREAEAKAREADIAKEQIFAKVKQEEQILDMETEEKRRKDADKEAKRLAKLARWQHEMGKDASDVYSGGQSSAVGTEEEEARKTRQRVSARVSPAEVAKYILNRTKQ